MHRTTHNQRTISLSPDMTEEYLSIPFTVDENTMAIHVAFEGLPPLPAIIDIGLEDPDRIRGWSGGSRSQYSLGLQSATPGYLAGPIPAGPWAVLLGLYRLPKAQTDVRIHVTRDIWVPGWTPGDLHAHSEHSDGVWDIPTLVNQAVGQGLEFLALTDHNTSSQNLHRPPADTLLTLIAGMEWTTYHGHANIWGLHDPLPDWRVRNATELQQKRNQVLAAGGMISINHPFDRFQPGIFWDWPMADMPAVEIWNGPWRPSNQEATDWWDSRLNQGERLIAVGGSDVHGPSTLVNIGEPTTWVYAEKPGAAGILDAIRQGRVYVTDNPKGPGLRLDPHQLGDDVDPGNPIQSTLYHLEPGDRVRWLSAVGILKVESAAGDTLTTTWIPQGDEQYVRLEVHRWRPDWEVWLPRLITNPLYIRPRRPL